MKYLFGILCFLIIARANGQSIVGTWQQTGEQTCLQTELNESQTEKELTPLMGASGTSVAKLITFDAKGTGKEGIFKTGIKKGASQNNFKYAIKDSQLQFLDKKSGIMTQHFVIDSLTESTLVIHNAMKDCESRMFSRIK